MARIEDSFKLAGICTFFLVECFFQFYIFVYCLFVFCICNALAGTVVAWEKEAFTVRGISHWNVFIPAQCASLPLVVKCVSGSGQSHHHPLIIIHWSSFTRHHQTPELISFAIISYSNVHLQSTILLLLQLSSQCASNSLTLSTQHLALLFLWQFVLHIFSFLAAKEIESAKKRMISSTLTKWYYEHWLQKISHILPTGQWYAPSAVINDALIMQWMPEYARVCQSMPENARVC